ncbi:MAG: glycosyltransferase family 39 protein [Victivallales bacterium]|jgi:4-amino-4-deoxy-L-arabinose transferase-like glycosyltransferase
MIRKHFYIFLVIIAFAGFLLRMQVCRELLDSDIQVSHPSSGTDMATYKELSERIMKGEYAEAFYYQPFYYAVFLPLAHKVIGQGIWPVMFAQAFLSALTVFFAALSSAMLWGRRAGVVTAFLTAFSAVLVLYVPYHLIETLQAFWITMILYFALIAWRSGKVIHWAITGLLVSFSILTRGNIWFFVPGLFAAAFFSVKISGDVPRLKKYALKTMPAFVFMIMVILPQIPFALRNSLISGKLSGPSTAAGAVLALGNTPEAPPGGRNPGSGPGPMEYPETYYAWMEKDNSSSVMGKIFEWARREPLAFMELQFRKMLLFWDYREIPNNIAFEYQGEKSPAFKNFAFVPTSLIMAMALGCFFHYLFINAKFAFRRIGKHPRTLICFYMIISFCIATAAFYILARFRLPSVPILAVGAGGFSGILIVNIRRRGWRRVLAGSVITLLLGLFIVFSAYDLYRYLFEAQAMRLLRPLGVRSELQNNKILYMDNGPFSFGSWTPFELKEGQIIRKRFSMRDSLDGRTAKFALRIACEIPGKLKVEINGSLQSFALIKGMNEKIFEIPLNVLDPQVVIKTVYLDCKAYSLLDFQRDYGRTEIDGKKIGAELVSKLYLETAK